MNPPLLKRLAVPAAACPGSSKNTRIDDDGVIDFSNYAKDGDKVTIITTAPLTKDEVWTKMENGGFVFFKNGAKVWEIIGTPNILLETTVK